MLSGKYFQKVNETTFSEKTDFHLAELSTVQDATARIQKKTHGNSIHKYYQPHVIEFSSFYALTFA